MSAYVTEAELELAIGKPVLLAYLDDTNAGTIPTATVDAFIARASALVEAWIAPVYKGPFPITQSPVPSMVRELTIQYVEALIYERRTELARNDATDEAKGRWARADAMGARLQSAVLRIPDYTAQPKPGNVGGVVIDDGRRVMAPNPDGTRNGGDF
jgi:hypothetical protein